MARRHASRVFIGRSIELAELHAAYEHVEAGAGRTLIVRGEAGIGKTRLITEFAAFAGAAGARVLAGSCQEMGGEALPFGPFVDALRGVAHDLGEDDRVRPAPHTVAELARILPELDRLDRPLPSAEPASAQARLFEAVLDLVHGLAAESPVVLVIDDVQWSDQSSRELSSFLARNLRTERVLLVVACRSDAPDPDHGIWRFLNEVAHGSDAVRIELDQFGERDVLALVTAILGEPPDAEVLKGIAARAEGNPLFIEELVAGSAGDRTGAIPPTLIELLLARVGRLTPTAWAVVKVVALAGQRAADELIAVVTGLSDSALDAAIREAVAGGVLTVGDDRGGYRFRHVLLGEAVAGELLGGERRRLHARIAGALEAGVPGAVVPRGTVLAELAYHWEQAGRIDEAFEASIRAGTAAVAMSAFAEAQRQFERALALWPEAGGAAREAGPRHDELLGLLASAAYLGGDPERAAAAVREAIDEAPADDPMRVGVLLRDLASYRSAAGDDAAALDALDQAARLVPIDPPSVAAARIRASLAAVRMLGGSFGESRRAAEEALAIARVVGDRELESQSLNFLGVDEVNLGATDAGLAHLRDAVEIANAISAPLAAVEAYNNLSFMLDRTDQLEEAVEVARRGEAAASRFGLERFSGSILRATAGHALARLGRWAESQAVLSEGLRLDPLGEPAIVLHKDRGRLLVWMGEFGPAAADLDEAERLATRSNRADTLPGIAAGRAELAIWQGRPGDAVRIVREALDRLAATEATFDVPALCALGLRAAADLAEEARARRVTVLLDEARSAGSGLLDRARGTIGAGAPAAPLANRGQRADLAVCAAEVARLEGEPASGLWAGAAAAWDAIQVPYPAAYARYREGEAILAERGSRGAAADRLSTARLSAATLSAKPLLEAIAALARRARVELEAAVAPSAPSAADRSAAAGRSLGLTARETDVLGLVTLGRTNRQIAQELFITEKTVGVHMTNILGKLGVPGRLDAAAVAQRVGIGPPPPAARELLPESTGEERPAPA